MLVDHRSHLRTHEEQQRERGDGSPHAEDETDLFGSPVDPLEAEGKSDERRDDLGETANDSDRFLHNILLRGGVDNHATLPPMELACLIPVLDRPANVAPLIASWKASRTPGKLVFLATATDAPEIAALEANNAVYYTTYAITWPQKQNWGVNRVVADWYLFGADDITFTPGWWDEVMKVAQSTGARVIGTNDQANPRVIAGDHSTHTVIARSYIREMGTIDADEAVCAFYHHNFVDDELLWTAKMREEWAVASKAVVAHHHPIFDQTVPDDATYQRGMANWQADMALFQQRATDLLGLRVS